MHSCVLQFPCEPFKLLGYWKKLAESVVVLAYFVLLYAAFSPVHTNEPKKRFCPSFFLMSYFFGTFFPFFLPVRSSLCWTGVGVGCHVLWDWLCVTRHGLSSVSTPQAAPLSLTSESWCWSIDLAWTASLQIQLCSLHKYSYYSDHQIFKFISIGKLLIWNAVKASNIMEEHFFAKVIASLSNVQQNQWEL